MNHKYIIEDDKIVFKNEYEYKEIWQSKCAISIKKQSECHICTSAPGFCSMHASLPPYGYLWYNGIRMGIYLESGEQIETKSLEEWDKEYFANLDKFYGV